MNPPDDHRRDDDFDVLLANYDDALAQGQSPSTADIPPDATLRQRLKEAQACLEILESAWPRGPNSAAKAAPVQQGPVAARMGRFELRRELGRGGFGVVFLAYDPRLRRDVAVKVPRPEVIVTDELRRRLHREAEAAARLDHPNLVAIHEVGDAGPVTYLVTEYCPGPTLSGWLKQQTAPVPIRDAARLVATLVDAVAYMHGQGVLHRDIKPNNILLSGSGTAPQSLVPKLTDFGLAKFTDEATHLTRSGAMLGTPAYMAPEQADSRLGQISAQTDIYALGIVLYETLTGRPPFQGENEAGTIRQVLNDEPPPPRRLRGDITRDLETICLKCLEKGPQRRYGTAAALAKDLRAFLEGNSIAARPAGNWKRGVKWTQRHPARATWFLGVAVALLTIVFSSLWYAALVRDHGIDVQGALKRGEEQRARQEAYASQIIQADALQGAERDRLLAPLLHADLPGSSAQDVRGFEWHYLWAQVLGKPRVLKAGHRSWANVQFSADGKWCASIGRDVNLRIWDVPSGRLRATLPLEIGRAFLANALFSSDGTRLLCWAHDPDGDFAVEFSLWEVPSGKLLVRRPVRANSYNYQTVSISPDGRLVAYLGTSTPNSSDEEFRVWDTVSGDDRLVHPMALTNAIRPILAVYGNQLTIAYRTGRAEHPGPQFIDSWDITTGQLVTATREPMGTVNDLAFSPDGRSLAAASYGQGPPRVCLFDAQTGQLRHSLGAFSPGQAAIAFSADGKTLAVGEEPEAGAKVESRVMFWDVASGSSLSRTFRFKSGVSSLSFSSDYRTIAVGCCDGDVALCDTSDLPAVAVVSMKATQGRPTCVAVSPNSSMYATGASDGTVSFSDLKTGRLLGEWQVHSIPVKSMAFLQEGRSLAVCASNGEGKADLTLWDVTTRTQLARVTEVSKCDIGPLAVEAPGQTIAFGNWDRDREEGSVGLWHWQSGQVEYLFRKQGARIRSVQISPDGRILAASRSIAATADDPNEIVLFELQEKKSLPALPGHAKTISSLSFSRYGTWEFLVSGSHDGSFKLWDLKLFKLHAVRAVTHNPVRKVVHSPDGRVLAVAGSPVQGGESASITLWEGGSFCRPEPEILRPGSAIMDMAFTANHQTIIVVCEDRQVCLWHPFDEPPPFILAVRGKKEAWSVAFSPDSQTLAVGYDDGANHDQETLKLWDVRTGTERANLVHGSMVSEVAFLPHSSTLVSVCYDKALRLWDFDTHRPLMALYDHADGIRCVAASQDGRLLASGGNDKVVKIWDAATGSVLHTLERHTEVLHRVSFAPDSKTVASADNSGELRICDVKTGQEIRLIKDNGHVFGLAYAPSGTILATGNQDGVVKLYDLKADGEPRLLFGHKGEVRFVTFSPDGKTLASGGADRTVRLWQVSTGRELLVFKDLPAKVNSLAFSPDGRHLAAAIHDGSVRLWHAAKD